MALKLNSNFKGTTAEYYKILAATSDSTVLKTKVCLGLYLSQDARTENINNFLERVILELPGANLSYDEIYTLIKQTEAFASAEDC